MFAWMRRRLRGWLGVEREQWELARDVGRLTGRLDYVCKQLGIEALPKTIACHEIGWFTESNRLRGIDIALREIERELVLKDDTVGQFARPRKSHRLSTLESAVKLLNSKPAKSPRKPCKKRGR